MAVIDDWEAFRANPDGTDKSHFAFMLMEAEARADFERIFGRLPGADGVISRLETLFGGSEANAWGYQIPVEANMTEADALALAEQVNANRVTWCRARGVDDLAEKLSPLRARIVDIETLKAAQNDFNHVESAIYDEVGDMFIDAAPDDPFAFALKEAVLMLTKWPDVTSYILAPYWPFDLDFEPAFLLYLGGYTSFAANDGIMVSPFGRPAKPGCSQ